MVVSMSVFGLAICSLAFAAVTRPNAHPVEQLHRAAESVPGPQFFAGAASPAPEALVPLEALLLQIERHVQLEQAAGESFHFAPTVESLHMKTMSPLVH